MGVANFLGEKVDILSKGSIVDLESIRVKIQEILESGFVQPRVHCRGRMGYRNFSMRDVFKVLQTGEVKPGSEDGDDIRGIFRVYGHDNEGVPLALVIGIDENRNQLKIITGFGY